MAEDFIGKGWCFPPHFDMNEKGVDMVSDREEIEQSLKILFSTDVGERLFHPDFGNDLKRFQFSSNSRVTLLNVQRLGETIVRQYEPRIKLNSVDINLEELMGGKLLVDLNYTIRNTGAQNNFSFSVLY
jgi:Phage baseplate assembly protein W